MCNAQGGIHRLTGGEGADIHVIRDDGTLFRNLPWGRDGNEFCQGHHCWRRRSTWHLDSLADVNVYASSAAAPACSRAGQRRWFAAVR